MRFCEKWRDVILFYEHKFVFFHITSQELHEILEALGIRYTFLEKKKKVVKSNRKEIATILRRKGRAGRQKGSGEEKEAREPS